MTRFRVVTVGGTLACSLALTGWAAVPSSAYDAALRANERTMLEVGSLNGAREELSPDGPESRDVPPANTCRARMDDPHYSKNVKGILAKGSWRCGTGVKRITFSLTLWKCGKKPAGGEEEWRQYDCRQVANDANNIGDIRANTPYTRYVPPRGMPPAHGSGWYIASNEYGVISGAGTKGFEVVSNPAYVVEP